MKSSVKAAASPAATSAAQLLGHWSLPRRRDIREDTELTRWGTLQKRALTNRAGGPRRAPHCTGDRGRRGLAGGDEGGAPAGPGRRTESPPPPPTRRVNKATTCASHLPEGATPRPLSPDGPDRVGRGQRDQTQARRRRQGRRQADAGQARVASSSGAVSAAPEVLGVLASLPGRGRPAVAGVEACAGIVPHCWRFAVSRRSLPGSDRGTAGAEGCERQQRRGLGLLERSHSIASGFRLPALPARIFLTRVFLMDSSLHCLNSSVGYREDILTSVELVRTVVSLRLAGRRRTGPSGPRAGPAFRLRSGCGLLAPDPQDLAGFSLPSPQLDSPPSSSAFQ
nr:PREDICTED: LOW QUALITY PROTEIN: uncharacterized protein ARIH2OS [Rhinolophus sinicus]